MAHTAETPLTLNSYRTGPDEKGHFGLYGGRFVAETLMPLILELEAAYNEAKQDPSFHAELAALHAHYSGRPSPLYFAERLTKHFGGAKVYFKRDELNHTGSHKINNCLGQILLAKRMGKTRIIAETAPGSMALRWRQSPRASGFPASCSWARRTSNARSPMCSACVFSAQRSAP